MAYNINKIIHADSNHLLIYIIINIKTPLIEALRQRNLKAIDRPKFIKFIEGGRVIALEPGMHAV
jgi:hypothetical protein